MSRRSILGNATHCWSLTTWRARSASVNPAGPAEGESLPVEVGTGSTSDKSAASGWRRSVEAVDVDAGLGHCVRRCVRWAKSDALLVPGDVPPRTMSALGSHVGVKMGWYQTCCLGWILWVQKLYSRMARSRLRARPSMTLPLAGALGTLTKARMMAMSWKRDSVKCTPHWGLSAVGGTHHLPLLAQRCTIGMILILPGLPCTAARSSAAIAS
jgi:hypothetical protein